MSDSEPMCLKRRAFDLAAGGIAVSLIVPEAAAQGGQTGVRVDLAVYPEKRIGKLTALTDDVPVAFTYPLEGQPNLLFKLGTEALRGIGPQKDVVAFSALCTHMGGSLMGRYRRDVKALGPCPFHFSVFDLRKGGMPVHASATQNLPQVLLRLDGDDIVAVGMIGLIYGQHSNLADGRLAPGTTPGRTDAPRIMRG